MLKKTLIALILVMTMLTLAACGGSKQPEQTTPETTTPETTTPAEVTTPEATTPETTKAEDANTPADTTQEDAAAAADASDPASEDPDAPTETADPAIIPEITIPELPEGMVVPDEMLTTPKAVAVTADGDVLTLRMGPDSTYEAIGAIPDETELFIEAEKDGWGLTNYDGQYGWISLDFIIE